MWILNILQYLVFTPHIYLIILISMIAGNLIEIIRLPKIQSRKCLRKSNLWRYSRKCLQKFNFNEIRSPKLSAYHLPQPKEFFPSTMFEMFSSISLSYLWPFVGCGVFSLCNLLLSVSRVAPLTLKNKLVTDSGHFYVWTASLIRLSTIERITISVKRKTDLELFCYNHPGCVCSARFIWNKTHLEKH